MTSLATDALLAPGEPPPVEPWHEHSRAPLLLVCDHASRRVPARLGRLGLAETAFDFHIAWDIGAAAVARLLALQLDAPLLLAGYSRLVIDLNRYPDDPTSIPEVSDGVAIPGNRGLGPEARAARLDGLFRPYHRAVAAKLAALDAAGPRAALIAIHSFTPIMRGEKRPWHVGILWDGDGRIARPLLAALRAQADLEVGDNQPYSAREPKAYTVTEHAEAKGRLHVSIELRQDLVASEAGAVEWCHRLADALKPILAGAV